MAFFKESGRGGHFAGRMQLSKSTTLKKWQKTNDCTIFVTGFLPGTSETDLANYFSRYGPVEDVHLNKNRRTYAFVSFASKQFAEHVLSRKSHVHFGKHLLVKPRHMRENNPLIVAPDNKEQDIFTLDQSEVMKKLLPCSSVDEQLLAAENFLQLESKDIVKRQQICESLEYSLQEFFPKCKIYLYGSSVNGYGLKGCDVDIALNLSHEEQNEHLVTSEVPGLSDVPDIRYVKSNRGFWRHILQMPLNLQLRFVQKILRKVQGCIKVFLIPSSRCPILRFQYHQYSCDLSIGKRLVLFNTRLLWLFGKVDHRVKQLCVFLRYWAKLHNVLGSRSCLTSYAFTLMIIFFLQTRNPPIIPSVQELVLLADASEKRSVEGWDCSFCEDLSKISPSCNELSAVELVKEFFSFYANFDFTLHVICPRNAAVLPKISPDFADGKFKCGPLCIQDPFDLCHNVAGNVNNNLLVFLTERLQYAALMCQTLSHISPNGYWGICKLLDNTPSVESNFPQTSELNLFNFEISLKTDMLYAIYEELPVNSSANAVKRTWLKKACNILQDVFEKALLFECHVIECYFQDEQPSKKRSSDVLEETDAVTFKRGPEQHHSSPESNKGVFSLKCDHGIKNKQGDQFKLKQTPILRTQFPHTSHTGLHIKTSCAHPEEKWFMQCAKCSTEIEQNDYVSTLPVKKDCLEIINVSNNEDKNILQKMYCKIFNRTWVGRNAFRKGLTLKDSSDNLLLRENYISQTIVKQSGPSTDKPLFEFECSFAEKHKGGLTCLIATIEPKSKSKEITVVASFLKSYVPKLVEQCMSPLANRKEKMQEKAN